MRKIKFIEGELYHIYNRGTDGRAIFGDKYDPQRFFQSMDKFNIIDPIGSIYANEFKKNQIKEAQLSTSGTKLVEIICYCLNQNHYHFILKQLVEGGIEKFMQKLGGGYTRYFNDKYKRSGVLFQGPFKATHIDSNEYLLYVSVYVNLNNKVHQLSNQYYISDFKHIKSSWNEYISKSKEEFCKKDIILEQFNNKKEYQVFAMDSLEHIIENKEKNKEME